MNVNWDETIKTHSFRRVCVEPWMWIMLGGERVADRRRVRRPLLSLPSPLSTQRNPCCHAAAAVADGGAGAPTLEGDVM